MTSRRSILGGLLCGLWFHKWGPWRPDRPDNHPGYIDEIRDCERPGCMWRDARTVGRVEEIGEGTHSENCYPLRLEWCCATDCDCECHCPFTRPHVHRDSLDGERIEWL